MCPILLEFFLFIAPFSFGPFQFPCTPLESLEKSFSGGCASFAFSFQRVFPFESSFVARSRINGRRSRSIPPHPFLSSEIEPGLPPIVGRTAPCFPLFYRGSKEFQMIRGVLPSPSPSVPLLKPPLLLSSGKGPLKEEICFSSPFSNGP